MFHWGLSIKQPFHTCPKIPHRKKKPDACTSHAYTILDRAKDDKSAGLSIVSSTREGQGFAVSGATNDCFQLNSMNMRDEPVLKVEL